MDCREFESVVGVRDPARRTHPQVLNDHLRSCLGCRERHLDVARLLDGRPTPHTFELPAVTFQTGRLTWARGLRAAALLAVFSGAAAILIFGGKSRSKPSLERTDPAPLSVRRVPEGDPGIIRNRIMSLRRGSRSETTITVRIWSPPPPRARQHMLPRH